MALSPIKRSARSHIKRMSGPPTSAFLTGALIGTAALVATAVLNRYLAKRAEHDNPPSGKFVNIDGLDVHYVERGEGPALVLLHGNGSMLQDFVSSGLIDAAAADHRVIVFDRPGFGHTKRPGKLRWGPDEQADLTKNVLGRLGVSDAIVLGHSWGASVAAALGVHYPALVSKLILVSGYYYPTVRPDFLAMSAPALPVVGDLLSQTNEVSGIPRGNGCSSVSNPCIGRRVRTVDSECRRSPEKILRAAYASYDNRGKGRQANRPCIAVCAIAPGDRA